MKHETNIKTNIGWVIGAIIVIVIIVAIILLLRSSNIHSKNPTPMEKAEKINICLEDIGIQYCNYHGQEFVKESADFSDASTMK